VNVLGKEIIAKTVIAKAVKIFKAATKEKKKFKVLKKKIQMPSNRLYNKIIKEPRKHILKVVIAKRAIVLRITVNVINLVYLVLTIVDV
jgi:hypothetical protein